MILEESYFDDEEELPEESVDGSGDISGLRQKKEDLQRVLQEQQQLLPPMMHHCQLYLCKIQRLLLSQVGSWIHL